MIAATVGDHLTAVADALRELRAAANGAMLALPVGPAKVEMAHLLDQHAEIADTLKEVIELADLGRRVAVEPAPAGPTGDGDADLRAAAAAVVLDMDVSDRRLERWDMVLTAIAAGAPPPDEVRVAEDGWSVDVRVTDEAAVRAFGAAVGLDAGLLAVRVYAPRRGAVVREALLAQIHPFGVRVWCEIPVIGP